MSNKPLRIAITHGDYNGIGYEVILKTFEDSRMMEMCTPILYGSSRIAAHYRKSLSIGNIPTCIINDPANAKPGVLNIVEVVSHDAPLATGTETPEAGAAAVAALQRAVADYEKGAVDAIVTAPISKHNVQSPNFAFPGHTEYFEQKLGDGNNALMILCDSHMRVALVTTHLPIGNVAQAITKEAVLEKLQLFDTSLKRDFAIHHPRIAVMALNPHAGDGGVIGNEEQNAIAPAIESARNTGIMAFGPYPADGFFGSGKYSHFDGVLAMYHDQGLAPFKSLAGDGGVNFTAGLPVVRTSPDHGTGFDIAGTGQASPQSMRTAIYAAIDIAARRRMHEKIHANPLPKIANQNSRDN